MENPYCQPPYCGDPPYNCPREELSSVCLQKRMAALHRTTLPLKKKTNDDDDDDDNSKDKSSKSMSPYDPLNFPSLLIPSDDYVLSRFRSNTIMLVFVLAIALAIIGFLCIRFNQRTNNQQNYDDRKSSTWSV